MLSYDDRVSFDKYREENAEIKEIFMYLCKINMFFVLIGCA